MPEGHPVPEPSLEAKSPFELRVSLGKNVPESDVRSALATGDMGFLHSFTTGSAVDGPGIRVVAWTAGCMWRCLYCHNPDTWTMTNGIPVTVEKATETLRKYRHGLKVMSGGFTLSGGEPLDAASLRREAVHGREGDGHPYGARFATAITATASATTTSNRSTSCCSISRRRIPNGIAGSPAWMSARRGSLPSVWRAPAAHLGPVRPRAWPDRRPRRHREDREVSRAALATWRESTCCPSIRWASTNGSSSAWNTRFEDVEPPSAELVERVCAVFRAQGLKVY